MAPSSRVTAPRRVVAFAACAVLLISIGEPAAARRADEVVPENDLLSEVLEGYDVPTADLLQATNETQEADQVAEIKALTKSVASAAGKTEVKQVKHEGNKTGGNATAAADVYCAPHSPCAIRKKIAGIAKAKAAVHASLVKKYDGNMTAVRLAEQKIAMARKKAQLEAAKAIEKRVEGVIDDKQLEKDEERDKLPNSEGLDRLLGDGRAASHHYTTGPLAGKVKPPGYASVDAYRGVRGHYYLGGGRRRVGAGFGRPYPQRNPGDLRELNPEQLARKEECKKRAAKEAEATRLDSLEQDLSLALVSGGVFDPETGYGVGGVAVEWSNYETSKVSKATTDDHGFFTLQLPRCDYFLQGFGKQGFVNITTEGAGACTEPLLMELGKSSVNVGMSRVMPASEMRVSLNWIADEKYAKDLDLHLLIPGERDVLLKGYAQALLKKYNQGHVDFTYNKAAVAAESYTSGGSYTSGAAKPALVKEQTFNNTDLAKYQDALDPPRHVFWDNTGWRKHFPFAVFELDHGMPPTGNRGHSTKYEGGPEFVHITKALPKQYLAWVDCWSCTNYQDPLDDRIKTRPEGVTTECLEAFTRSQAFVRVFQGSEQTQCSSIRTAKSSIGAATTRWDAGLFDCTEVATNKTCAVKNPNRFNPLYPTTKAGKHVRLAAAKAAIAAVTESQDAVDADELRKIVGGSEDPEILKPLIPDQNTEE